MSRKYYVQIGAVQTPAGPADLIKEVVGADGFKVNDQRMLVFYRRQPDKVTPIIGSKDLPLSEPVTDAEFCTFNAWNFVYSDEALPADLVKATSMPTRQ